MPYLPRDCYGDSFHGRKRAGPRYEVGWKLSPESNWKLEIRKPESRRPSLGIYAFCTPVCPASTIKLARVLMPEPGLVT